MLRRSAALRALALVMCIATAAQAMGVGHNPGVCATCDDPGTVFHRRVVSSSVSSSGAADPCARGTCGPNTYCQVNSRGIGVCRCLEGYFPKPDTITGCGPQCYTDGECGAGFVCRSTRCVQVTASSSSGSRGGGGAIYTSSSSSSSGGVAHRTSSFNAVGSRVSAATVSDPCSLGLCGTNANCDGVSGRAVCSCPAGYYGNPLSACNRGDCIADADCPNGLACLGVRCVSPCAEQPCGTNAQCKVVNRRAICTCPTGYTGDPLSQCTYNPTASASSFNSPTGAGGTRYQSVCTPSPCGENTDCREKNGRAVCSCIQNYIGNPLTGCRPECTSDAECSSSQACVQNRCRNACTDACGTGAKCEAVNHRAVCTCPQYYRGDGLTGCYPECTSHAECGSTQACIQLRCGDPCEGACGIGAQCRVERHTAICSCPRGYTGHPYDRCSPPQQSSPAVSSSHSATAQGIKVGAGAAGVFASAVVSSGDLCSPNPCGQLADCNPGHDRSGERRPVCTCPVGYLGDPLIACRAGDCTDHSNCPAHQACYNYQCTNPCIGDDGGSVCGVNADCRPQNHQGVCTCPAGYDGDPLTQCNRKPLALNTPGGNAGTGAACATC